MWELNKDGRLQCNKCHYIHALSAKWVHAHARSQWPRRNCTNQPNLRPTADALGLPNPSPQDLTQIIARYAAGQPLGPGDYLHNLILKWVGEGPTRKCGCEDRIRKMNEWGPDGCREHLEEIVGWLVEQAEKHEWVKKITITINGEKKTKGPPVQARLARWLTKLPGGKIPLAMACRRMVLKAIRQAENQRLSANVPSHRK
jgi:hypothetical protein